VMRARRVFAGRAIVAFARPNPEGRWRIGVTASRRLRSAVDRNRLRRRLREVARACLLPVGPRSAEAGGETEAFDVVLIARPAALELPQAALEEEAVRVRSRLAGLRP
jgi:ribonuclease P protein component